MYIAIILITDIKDTQITLFQLNSLINYTKIMTDLELFKKMLAYLEARPSLIVGLCLVEGAVRIAEKEYSSSATPTIFKYKPTWKSKFWWHFTYNATFDAFWWKLSISGMEQRVKFLKHIIKKLESES